MRLQEIRAQLEASGARDEHVRRILRDWILGRSRDAGRRPARDYLPQSVRDALPALDAQLARMAHILSTHPAEDGSARLLVGLADGQAVESVLLPRDGVCVSSQVGCAVGCRFCMTGTAGLVRQVSSGEIVAQVALARTLRPVKKVVFMGMGEPSHNLANVMDAIELLCVEGNVAHKNLVFSTVGDARVPGKLLEGAVKPALALSLHTTRAELRAQLLPNAPRLSPAELVDMGEDYARRTGYPVQYQWTLLEGVNDGPDEMEGIVALLKGKYAVLNMIPYNAVEGLPYRRPDWERSRAIAAALHARGVLTKLRDSAGQDVDGGCGQLRARALGARRAIPIRPA